MTEDQEKTLAVASKAAKPAATPAGRVSSRVIENVSVELRAFLGNVELRVAELTALAAGSVLALDAPLNAAVVLELNGVAVARGELVAVGDNFGVRLTEIVPWPD